MMRTGLTILMLTLCGFIAAAHAQIAPSSTPQPLSETQRTELTQRLQQLESQLDSIRSNSGFEDAAIFAKGVNWALRYDKEFSAADLVLLNKALDRGTARITALKQGQSEWLNRKGKLTLGYTSRVDGSIQPYGLIIPQHYSPQVPMRLDVVLHGSTRPVGLSELRFMNRFDEGDAASANAPSHNYIELHPLGRVENCYRWAGEADVFEAIADVRRRFKIDGHRIVLRGMSMGASGTWHLGLKHPDRFAALGPYCGYVDTHRFSETPISNFVKVGALPEHQELGLHMLDSVDYAANAGVIPTVACMGEKDIFFQAHVLMGDAMKREGLTMVNLISPGTGHVIDPKTHALQLQQIESHLSGRSVQGSGPEPHPPSVRFVTWTLKYNRCHWVELLGLKQHYARAEFNGRIENDKLICSEPINVTRFAINAAMFPGGHSLPREVQIGNQTIAWPTGSRVVIEQHESKWQIETEPSVRRPSKSPGLQGPIDDAFTSPFVCVRGTGKAWNAAVQAYADNSLKRFADEWHHYFRGDLPIKDDSEITDEDLRTRNLILFGDPGSNRLIAKVLPNLPLVWTPQSFRLIGQEYSSAEHSPALIAPNPLVKDAARYVVINSGHTFRESELAKLNYLLFPRWGDWAALRVKSEAPFKEVLRAGYFDESWSLPQ